MPGRRIHVRSWLVALTLMAGAPLALAHEIGTTRVVAEVVDDRHYAFAVTTDADVLLARLQTARKQPRSSPRTTADFSRDFSAVCDDVTGHLTVMFDNVPSAPQAECAVEEAAPDVNLRLNPPGVTVTLRGTVPVGARAFSWRYDLTFASYALVVRDGGRSSDGTGDITYWLEGNEVSPTIALATVATPVSRSEVARTYFGLGFTHILPLGADHILFVLGIFLLSRRLRPMLWQVSAFTLAHSITLGLTLYGIIDLPSSIVEPLIAVSIVYVAVENIVTSQLKPWRVGLVFGFGLLHGMGFAGVLRELALPRSEFLTGLIAFNAGVEAGQLTVLLGAFVLVGGWARHREGYRRVVVVPGSVAIALTGLFWTIQRGVELARLFE